MPVVFNTKTMIFKTTTEPTGLYGLPHSVIRMIINMPNSERLTLDERCKKFADMPLEKRLVEYGF
jgi:hypothetical protein